MKKMWAFVLAVLMVSLNMVAVAEEAGGTEPLELKEYHMNLERFRGEPDNMIDPDGNIIFGNAASYKSKTGKNVMLMSYSEEKTLMGDNTVPVMILAFSTGFRASGLYVETDNADYWLQLPRKSGFDNVGFFVVDLDTGAMLKDIASSKRVSMTFNDDYGDKCSFKLTKEQYYQLELICDEYDEVLEPYWKDLKETAKSVGLDGGDKIAFVDGRAKVSVSYKPGKQPKSENEVAATDTDGTVWTAVINTQNSPLTMRDAPSQSGRTICKIPKGETVTVLKKGDWAKVEYDGEQGYVNGKYLKYEE